MRSNNSLTSPQVRHYSAGHEEESFEDFTKRYVAFFDQVEDLFELQRGLNNCFAYDLVPAPEICESAIRASRRVNDFSTAVRIFVRLLTFFFYCWLMQYTLQEGIKEKVENQGQYEQYLDALKPLREELGGFSYIATNHPF